MTANTITPITSLVEAKTIAIKLETLGFFAVTKYFFI
jgi:hypothetical protein